MYLKYGNKQETKVAATELNVNFVANTGDYFTYKQRIDDISHKLVLEIDAEEGVELYGFVARVLWTKPIKDVSLFSPLNYEFKRVSSIENEAWIYPKVRTTRKWLVTTIDSFPYDLLITTYPKKSLKLLLSYDLLDAPVKSVSSEFSPIVLKLKIAFAKKNKFYYTTRNIRIFYKDLIGDGYIKHKLVVKRHVPTVANNEVLDFSKRKVFKGSQLTWQCPLFYKCVVKQSDAAWELFESKALEFKDELLFYNNLRLDKPTFVWLYETKDGNIAYHKVIFSNEFLRRPIDVCEIFNGPVVNNFRSFVLYARAQVPVTYVKIEAQAADKYMSKTIASQKYQVGSKKEFLLDNIYLPKQGYDKIVVYFFNKSGSIDACLYKLNEITGRRLDNSEKKLRTRFSPLGRLLDSFNVKAAAQNNDSNARNVFTPIVSIVEFFPVYLRLKEQYTAKLKIFDPDGDFLTYFTVDMPPWAQMSGRSDYEGSLILTVSGKPNKPGNYNFKVGITDGKHTIYRNWTVTVGNDTSKICLVQPGVENFFKWVKQGSFVNLKWDLLDTCKETKAGIYLTTTDWPDMNSAEYLGDIMLNLGEYLIDTSKLKSAKYHVWFVYKDAKGTKGFIQIGSFNLGNLDSVDFNPNPFINVLLISPADGKQEFELNTIRFVVRLFASKGAVLEAGNVRVYLDNKDITDLAVFSKTKASIITLLIPLENLSRGSHKLQIWVRDSKGEIAQFIYRFSIISQAESVVAPITILDDKIVIAGIVVPKSQLKVLLGGVVFFIFALLLPLITYLIEKKSRVDAEIRVSNTDLSTFEANEYFGTTLKPGDEIVLD